MSAWSVNNRACTSAWMALRLLDQSSRVFAVSGTIKMRELAFWSTAASDAMRRLQAATLAKQLDNVFRLVDGAELEPGVVVSTAVNQMATALTNGDGTMSDLADVCDGCYHFWGEP